MTVISAGGLVVRQSSVDVGIIELVVLVYILLFPFHLSVNLL